VICLQYTAIAIERHKPGAVVVAVVGVVAGVVAVVVRVVFVVETLNEINKHIIRDITPVMFVKLI